MVVVRCGRLAERQTLDIESCTNIKTNDCKIMSEKTGLISDRLRYCKYPKRKKEEQMYYFLAVLGGFVIGFILVGLLVGGSRADMVQVIQAQKSLLGKCMKHVPGITREKIKDTAKWADQVVN